MKLEVILITQIELLYKVCYSLCFMVLGRKMLEPKQLADL
jgi:hypothetical protein